MVVAYDHGNSEKSEKSERFPLCKNNTVRGLGGVLGGGWVVGVKVVCWTLG
jgi:hypothetical protein